VIDGADEVDPDLNVVKGRGGALLREKVGFLQCRRWVLNHVMQLASTFPEGKSWVIAPDSATDKY